MAERKPTLLQAAMLMACLEEGGATHRSLLQARVRVGGSDDPMVLVAGLGPLLCRPFKPDRKESLGRHVVRSAKFGLSKDPTAMVWETYYHKKPIVKVVTIWQPFKYRKWIDRKKGPDNRFRYFLTSKGKKVLNQWLEEETNKLLPSEGFDWRPNETVSEDFYA